MMRNIWLTLYVVCALYIVYSEGWRRRGWGWHRPKGNRQITICQGRSYRIRCRNKLVIKILSAEYGRTSSKTCRSRLIKTTKCRLNVNKKLQELCEGKQKCRIYPSNKLFADPCPGTAKYLKFTYKCVKDINECASQPCKNDGTCKDKVNSYTCECKPGYIGVNCQTDRNECSPNPCQNGAVCNDGINEFRCKCSDDFTGPTCNQKVNKCTSSPCQHGGTCENQVHGYTCTCKPGYSGNNCQTDIDECKQSPCRNGGKCTDQVNGYICTCNKGYKGVSCETDIDDCEKKPCQNGGTCIDKVNGYICTCIKGYTGLNCETDIDDCIQSPCQNGGTCADQVNGYSCTCIKRYKGVNCETDIDDCIQSPCQNGGNCTDQVNGYICTCNEGYNGVNCETDIDDCKQSPCQNEGTCIDQVNGYMCTCIKGFNGANCETDIDDCQPFPCLNGGTCADQVNAYMCTCKEGYKGVNCETDVDECQPSPCQHGGTCTDKMNGYICVCGPGHTGVNCQTDTSSAFECGTPYIEPILFQPRIVGGVASRNHSWPWIVQLRLNDRHECGGAIIAPLWVATAKHCFLTSTNVTEWTIYAGKTHKALDEPITQQKRQMIKIVDSPNPTNNFLNKDIALVKVDTNFTYNNYVRPICLPWRDVKEGDRCFVKGWGSTQGTGNESVLKQTTVPVRNTQECNTTINPILVGQITNYMFCAGFSAGGHDACQGDSGGPFDCRYSDDKWHLSGIVSWGIGCAEKNLPGVYVNVVEFVDWITNTITHG